MSASLQRIFALVAASLLTASAMAQSSTQAVGPIQTLGCYSDSGPLTEFGDATFQTDGYCQVNCTHLDPPAPVMAIVGGSTCYCGSELPPLDKEVSSDHCNSPCQGFGDKDCGGIGYWQVYLSGLTANVHNAPNSSSSSLSSTATGGASSSTAAIVTKAGETVFVTNPASTDAPQKSSSGGSNKVGIAVGVVVGVIGLAAIIGVVVFVVKRKRNREIEEEHRRNAATSYAKSDKSANDARLDPSIYSHSRQSIGSIADERDFSRRILQVS